MFDEEVPRDHRDARRRTLLVRSKGSTENRTTAHHTKEIRRDIGDGSTLVIVEAAELHAIATDECHTLDGPVEGTELLEPVGCRGIGGKAHLAVIAALVDHPQAIGIAIGQTTEHAGV